MLHHSTVFAISTIQLNLPQNHREADNFKTVELMYLELLKRFEGGKSLKKLHPVSEMEIEFDPDCDTSDIHELVRADEKVSEELMKPEMTKLSQAQIEEFSKKEDLKK